EHPRGGSRRPFRSFTRRSLRPSSTFCQAGEGWNYQMRQAVAAHGPARPAVYGVDISLNIRSIKPWQRRELRIVSRATRSQNFEFGGARYEVRELPARQFVGATPMPGRDLRQVGRHVAERPAVVVDDRRRTG